MSGRDGNDCSRHLASSLIVDAIGDGLALFDDADILVDCNAALRNCYRSIESVNEIIGLSYPALLRRLLEAGEFAGKAVLADAEAWIARRLAEHKRGSGTVEEALADGRIFDVRTRRTATNFLLLQWHEVTDRRRARARLRDIVDAALDGFAVWDQTDRLVMVNSAYADRHAGPDGPPEPGSRFADVLDGLIAANSLCLDIPLDEWASQRRAMRTSPTAEMLMHYRDGRYFLLTERRMRDGGLTSALTDVTAMKIQEQGLIDHGCMLERANIDLEMSREALERHGETLVILAEELELAKGEAEFERDEAERARALLRRSHDLLEERVAERTAELRIAKEQAEAANKGKSEFLAMMGHELRTPLNAIIGFSETMLSGVFGPIGNDHHAEYIGDMHQSAVHLLHVLNDILDVSRIEAGKMVLDEELVDLREVCAACVAMLETRALAGQVRLTSAIPDEAPSHVLADRRVVLQILLNLLSNGIKFTLPGGSVTLSVAVTVAGELGIAIADTGIGMDEHEIKLAMEPFAQVDSRLSRRYEGTGLGLPLSDRLTGLHGGRLIIDSAKGRGTTVTILLPGARLRMG